MSTAPTTTRIRSSLDPDVLGREDTPWLMERYAATGDRAYAEALLAIHRPLAISRARRLLRPEVEMDDLVQVSMMAMWKAIDRFRPDRGATFATFAVRTIDGELKRYYRDRVWGVRVPRGPKTLSLRVVREQRRFIAAHDRTPTHEELAEAAGLSVTEVEEGLAVAKAYRSASLDAPIGDGSATVGDMIPVRAEGPAPEEMVDVLASIRKLPERQRRITYMRFYDDMTQQEIADLVGCSQMHISRLLRRSIDRLKADLTAAA